MEVSYFSQSIAFSTRLPADEFSYGFERYLYNETAFLQLHPNVPISFYIFHTKKKEVLGRCHFFLTNAIATSPYRSPFGGIELDPSLSLDLIEAFIAYVEHALQQKGAQAIKITQVPFVYDPTSASKLTNCYLRAGFQITHPDPNHHITIGSARFEQKIHAMEGRKLKKAITQGLVFKEEPMDSLEEIYAFIQARRKEKRQNLNISLQNLHKAVHNLPHHYKIFTVKAEQELIATSIIIVVNDKIAYNFLPASTSAYNKWSPMVFLLKGLYEWCQERGIRILDLGISSVDNTPQYSLIAFKERIGGELGLKCTFFKTL